MVSRLGEGGIGVVFEAVDRHSGARVALKTLRHMTPAALLRFKDEFRALQEIAHPNLVQLGELVEEDGHWCFTMELVPGRDFLEHVRGTPAANRRTLSLEEAAHAAEPAADPVDPDRLRAAVVQLARGVAALHRHDKIHRDVKPTNVRVTPEGRVVLLDFGLVSQTGRAEGVLVGTVAYIAPEQAAGEAATPASDWYAVGALLYEALTGRLPFSGTPGEILARKRREEPTPPDRLGEVPADLGALCQALLRREPEARPSGEEILERLSQRRIERRPRLRVVPAVPFVGRRREIDVLTRALLDSRRAPVVAVLHGEPGVGKTAVARRFADGSGARVVFGRCHPRESVPFRALDAIVDELCRSGAAPEPAEAALLAPLFPVLGQQAELVYEPPHDDDPRARRARAFAALRGWLRRLAAAEPLVLIVDDLQWADADGRALLADLIAAADGPRALVICTCRRGQADAAAFLPGDVRHVAVEPLDAADARALALGLGGSEELAARAGGLPLYIEEAVMNARAGQEGAVGARAGGLENAARALLEITALAGAPVLVEVAARAAGVTGGELGRQVAALRLSGLCRTSQNKGIEHIEPSHDLVREAVLDRLTDGARRALHARLAAALEEDGRADDEARAIHRQLAGDHALAAEHAELAAAVADRALAFDRAARLWRLAVEVRRGAGTLDGPLLIALARALDNAGLGAEAAAPYLEAAELAEGASALDLRRAAAEQLLRAGRIDDGLDAIRGVLGAAGLGLPRSPEAAAAGLLYRRAQVALRGYSFKLRRADEIPPEELARVDLTWAVAGALGTVDLIRGMHFQTLHLLAALRAGEPFRVARALAVEAPYLTSTGGRGRRRAAELVRAACALAQSTGEPRAMAMSAAAAGWTAMQEGRWRTAARNCDRAEALFRSCNGVHWELTTIQIVGLYCLAYLGEIGELGRRLPTRLLEADARGDAYASTNLRVGLPSLTWLAEHDPARVRAEAERALAGWSRRGFLVQHAFALISRVHADLYEGQAYAAKGRIEEAWPALRRSMLLKNQYLRIALLDLRARAGLAAGDDPSQAIATSRRLEREGVAWAVPIALTLRACAALRLEDDAGAAWLFAEAAQAADDADMPLHAAVARLRRSEIGGSDDGAEGWMITQRIRRPDRMVALCAP